jgi:hypothetical protein
MAWESRGNGQYYYQKRRVGQQVISLYVGKDELANLFAQLDSIESEKRDFERWQQEEMQKELEADLELDRRLDEVGDMVRGMKTAVLLIHGFHTHKRQWRRYVSK